MSCNANNDSQCDGFIQKHHMWKLIALATLVYISEPCDVPGILVPENSVGVICQAVALLKQSKLYRTDVAMFGLQI